MLSRQSVRMSQGNDLTRSSSENSRPQLSQLAEPLWTDPDLKSKIGVRELISTEKKGWGWGGDESSRLPPKTSHVRKKKATSARPYKAITPPLPPCEPYDLAVRSLAGKQKDLGLIRFGSLFSSKIVVYGHCLVTLPTQLMKH